ncbi:MAG: DUF1549 domain-containing protein [Gemmataceae bacterium]
MHRLVILSLALSLGNVAAPATAADTLPQRIDALIDARAKGKPISPPADDGEFLRRVTLDLAGTIPTAEETRRFLADSSPDKRDKRIDDLLKRPGYARRMADVFHVQLMERLGDHSEWQRYLESAFGENRPWDQIVREILQGQPSEGRRGAAFFLAKRLENFGQNPVDYPGLARDVGRLFLGRDLRCAQCHDHLFVKEYKQADFQGLFLFVQNAYLVDGPRMMVGEKPLAEKASFQSVFGKVRQQTGPRVPGRKEVSIPKWTKAEEYLVPADPRAKKPGVLRFSPLAALAREVPDSPDFARNFVNRLWWMLMGRGLVHPLDLHHADNPPSHPELLALLSQEFREHRYDIRWMIGQMMRTRVYQRSSLLPEGASPGPPGLFLTGIEKRLSAEQILAATLQATGMRPELEQMPKDAGKATPLEQMRQRMLKAYAAQPREPEDEVVPALQGALFLLNDSTFLTWFAPRSSNLAARLDKLDSLQALADELYLNVVTRLPSPVERDEVRATLAGRSGTDRQRRIGQLIWALVASTEFSVNH